ncbi:hypothetical protein [Bosea sp. (in: a-proteobacteria)]|uniref:hypothetical protein n=1 Tax=Bosea sp. (in: a-proteobacteria) TaxID=1871050 RepID=UPI003B3BDE68
MSGADHRIVAAVEMLRSLAVDGFSIAALVKLANSPIVVGRRELLEAYRVEAPVVAGPPPVFATFAALWPEPIEPGRPREVATQQWRTLTAAEQAEAIAALPAWTELRRMGRFSGPGPVTLYLRDRSWRRMPKHVSPTTERTTP